MVFCGPERRVLPVPLPSSLATVPAVDVVAGVVIVPFAVACAFCGVLAAVVMDFPMARQTEGFTPAYIAASVLTRSQPDTVGFAAAFAVHHVSGAAAGILYAAVYLTAVGPLPAGPAVGGVAAMPHALGTLAVAGFIYAFFAYLVLPRRGRRIYEERSTAVRGQWLRSVVVFGATVALAVPAVTSVL